MPSATPELQDRIIERFGDIDAGAPLDYLLTRGWSEVAGLLVSPEGHPPTDDEMECVDFLFQEWDFGYDGDGSGQ